MAKTITVDQAKQRLSKRIKVPVEKLTYIGTMDNRPQGGSRAVAMFNTPTGHTMAENIVIVEKPSCWCGMDLIEEVDGFLLGFLNCPVHGCYYEQEDKGHAPVVEVPKAASRRTKRRTV